jgi:hypothetical protein
VQKRLKDFHESFELRGMWLAGVRPQIEGAILHIQYSFWPLDSAGCLTLHSYIKVLIDALSPRGEKFN